jgi:hypothetical protein
MSDRISVSLRRMVARRAGDRCEYCRCPAAFSPSPFSIEHILPRNAGGQTEPENLALSCQGCNNHKHTKVTDLDPATTIPVPLYNPRQMKWNDHFAWSADASTVLGLTGTGRATILSLKLNRIELLNLRTILTRSDLHPPDE